MNQHPNFNFRYLEMDLIVPLTSILCAATGVATYVENRNRRRIEAEEKQRLIKAGLFVAGVLGIVYLLTKK